VQDSHRARESQFLSAPRDGEGIFRIFHSAAEHGVDVHLKHRVIGQQLQLLVEHLQALF
jgi:hypothetical protein